MAEQLSYESCTAIGYKACCIRAKLKDDDGVQQIILIRTKMIQD